MKQYFCYYIKKFICLLDIFLDKHNKLSKYPLNSFEYIKAYDLCIVIKYVKQINISDTKISN